MSDLQNSLIEIMYKNQSVLLPKHTVTSRKKISKHLREEYLSSTDETKDKINLMFSLIYGKSFVHLMQIETKKKKR